MNTTNNHPDTDPKLVKLIQLLRPVPERDPQMAERGKEKFLWEIEELFEDEPIPSTWLQRIFGGGKQKAETGYQPRLALTAFLVVAVLALFLFGGAGITVYAAQNALPGDTLYSFKTRLEQTRLALTPDDYRSANIQLALAQERLGEIEALIQENRFSLIGTTAVEFERHILLALEAMQRLAQVDPVRAGQLSERIMAELNRYIQSLSDLLEKLPDDVKTEVEETISNSANLSRPQDENENENLNENDQGDGNLPQAEDKHENENRNENESPQESEIENENQNANLNENDRAKNENETKEITEFNFVGFVEYISPAMWQISGIKLMINSDTKIEANIAVGDKVEVKVQWQKDQPVNAREIRLRQSSQKSDNENKNENDQGAENDNMNENVDSGKDQQNSNDSHENENDNKNDDSGNKNQNTNENSNDNKNSNTNDQSNNNENLNDSD